MEYNLQVDHRQDVYDCISAMLEQEDHYLCYDYTTANLRSKCKVVAQHEAIDPFSGDSYRSKMCEWIFSVIDCTKLQRETAVVAMSYLDRFLCSSCKQASKARSNPKEYQLAAMTCFYIAVKIREPFEMDASFTSLISRGTHSAEEITSLEYVILTSLQWKLNGPTSIEFVNYLLELLPLSSILAAPILYAYSHAQAELAVKNSTFLSFRQSTIAIASLLNAFDFVALDDFSLRERILFLEAISNAFNNLDVCSTAEARSLLHDTFSAQAGFPQVICRKKSYAAAA
ncbi:hypothetical protein ACHAXR_011833 [Thalassiosira sp. AJA248-18]